MFAAFERLVYVGYRFIDVQHDMFQLTYNSTSVTYITQDDREWEQGSLVSSQEFVGKPLCTIMGAYREKGLRLALPPNSNFHTKAPA